MEKNLQLSADQIAAMTDAQKAEFINWLLNHVEIECDSGVHHDIKEWCTERNLPTY